MGKIKTTQHDRIIDYVRKHGSITTLEAFTDLGITKLTTRISEMRRMGMDIRGERVTVKNRYDEECSVNRYTIMEDEAL
jgi:DeoR/GlpR family transcriptional regulator of sugar metabolism